MLYRLLFLLIGSFTLIYAETSTIFDRIKVRLESSARKLPIKTFDELPDASSYLNNDLVKNAPNIINVNEQLTSIIRVWSPQLLALDPTSPYYFSKYNNISIPEHDRNLIAYLQAIEFNETLANPFVNILPQTYRNAIPILSVFGCSELSTSNEFFHNIELIVGPGQTELPIKRQSSMFSQMYCSLYGWPQFILIDQTKQPEKTYDMQTLLSQENLSDIDFYFTRLEPGSCLFVPTDWTTSVQLNNSISLVYTLKRIEKQINNETDDQLLPCTNTTKLSTLDTITFTIIDNFNISDIGLIAYFYRYLNPPVFNNSYSAETFLDYFQQDRNVSQIVMKWTPELIDLIKITLFNQLDLNQDGRFSADDFFKLKQTNIEQLKSSMNTIFEELRQHVFAQFNELNEMISKISQQMENLAMDENAQEKVLDIIDALPDHVKEKLLEKNLNTQDIFDKVKHKKPKRPVRAKDQNRQNTREDDASTIFDDNENEEILFVENQDEEEEIIAEPIIIENQSHRTDL